MNRLSSLVALVLVALAVVSSLATAAKRPEPAQATATTPSILRVGLCYRIAFTIDSAPAYKVLEIMEAGWIRAEVDAGSGQAQRVSFWANTAHMVTIREQRCSE